MRRYLNWLKIIIFPLFLVIIVGFISWANYIPDTILSGWDALHPEFNLSFYLKRVFLGVWQEHQGVGALATQSHSSELSRMPLFLILNLFLPFSLVRYAFFVITLLLGTLGVYFAFLVFVGRYHFYLRISAFLGALFYLLNLYTVQQYYVPLEMFAVYFASVPWLFFALACVLRKFNRKNLLIFVFISFFSSSIAHTPTLFYTFSLCFLLFFISYLLFNFSFGNFKKLFLIGIIYLFVNLFWILPNVYFLLSGGNNTVENSRIHLNFTTEAFLQNKAFGDFKNLVLGKSFLFNWREFNLKENTFVDLLDEWEGHSAKPYFYEFNLILFVLSFLGFFLSLFLREGRYVKLLFPPFLVSAFFIINENPPFGYVFSFLRDNYPVFREALRFPFNKFSFTFTFPLAIFLSFFVFSLFEFSFRIRSRILRFALVSFSCFFAFFVSFLIFYRSLPVFQGYLISPSMKVAIPEDYFQLFNWFLDKDSNLRIAKLPLQTHWGWVFYKWDYQGAGFTWFGLRQPTFDREFDRWNPYNETFYNEASNILYKYSLINLGKDGPCQSKKECEAREKARGEIENWNYQVISEFEKVLEKYQVSYLLLDESVLNAGGDSKLLFILEIKDLIAKSSRIKEVARFGFLTVYEFDLAKTDLVKAPSEYVAVDAELKYSKYDPIYQKYGEYITYPDGIKENLVGYPFLNFDPRGDVTLKLEGENLQVENKKKNAKVILPVFDLIKESFGEEQGFKEGYNCDLKKKGTATKKRLEVGNFYGAYDGGVSCDWFYYPNLKRSKTYVLRIKGKNLEGRSLKIYLQNLRTNRMDIEELLPSGEFDSYFVILPSELDLSSFEGEGKQILVDKIPTGYTLNVETRSFGRIASENIIEDITFIPIDIDWFYQVTSLSGGDIQKIKNNLEVLSFKKYGTFFYQVKVEGSGVLQLGQGYDKGWVALYLPDSKLQIPAILEHIKVNSWSNGWIVNSLDCQDQPCQFKSSVFIIFWPQFLEWIGLFLLGVTLVILLRMRFE